MAYTNKDGVLVSSIDGTPLKCTVCDDAITDVVASIMDNVVTQGKVVQERYAHAECYRARTRAYERDHGSGQLLN